MDRSPGVIDALGLATYIPPLAIGRKPVVSVKIVAETLKIETVKVMQEVDGRPVDARQKYGIRLGCLLRCPRCHLVFSLALRRMGGGGATQAGRWGQEGTRQEAGPSTPFWRWDRWDTWSFAVRQSWCAIACRDCSTFVGGDGVCVASVCFLRLPVTNGKGTSGVVLLTT